MGKQRSSEDQLQSGDGRHGVHQVRVCVRACGGRRLGRGERKPPRHDCDGGTAKWAHVQSQTTAVTIFRLEYGIIDEIIEPNEDKAEKAAQYWIRSGRAESEGRLEQWQEYLSLQEEYALKDSFRKVMTQDLRAAYRDTSSKLLKNSSRNMEQVQEFKERLPDDMLTENDEVRLPFSRDGVKLAILNAECYAERNIARQVAANKVSVPDKWRAAYAARPAPAAPAAEVDYDALIRAVEAMDEKAFATTDLDTLVEQYRVPA